MTKKLLCTALCLSALIGCTTREEEEHSQAQVYALQTIETQDVTLTKSYPASIRGCQDIRIIPRISGHLVKVNTIEGDKVRKGETLFVIDQVPYKAELESAEASVTVANAAVENAKLIYESKQLLFDKKVISSFDLQSAKNAYTSAKAQLTLANSKATFARNNLSYTSIKSPTNGVIGKLPYREGDYVSTATTDGLTMVSDNEIMYIYFSITERHLIKMIHEFGSMEDIISNIPQIELQLSDKSIYPIKGNIESISGIVDYETGAVSVRAEFKNPKGVLLSGASGNVLIPDVHKDAIVVPQEATFEIQDKTFAYQVIDGKTVAKVIEKEEYNDGKSFIITKGLSTGDVIIAKGAGLVREDTEVAMP